MAEIRYGFDRSLPRSTFDEAVRKVTEGLKAEGFGVLTEIDVARTLKQKLDVDFPRTVILGACNPSLAHRALTEEPHIGLLLPCNVVVSEHENGTIRVGFADPRALFSLVDNPNLQSVADDVYRRLRRVADSL
jgi:uncharacterized protein (DUF302 family)